MAELHHLSAAELSRAYADGSISPADVVRAVLARVDAWEPKINAMYRIHRSGAIAQADASTARWRAGSPLSALDGVPVTLKDNIATAGDPMPLGTAAHAEAPAQTMDAPAAARVREAGCVVLGKTTMPDYGMLSSGLSSLHGITRNPWNTSRNPSGSSSGAGAAGAAGYGPLHLGTDIGGSVRLPGTHCGLFALKPTFGRVPVYPPFLGRVVGPMTRTVRDAALLMDIIARPDARDFTALPPGPDLAPHVDGLDPSGLSIGLMSEVGAGLAVHSEVRHACEEAARTLERAGARVVPIPGFLTGDMLDGMCRFFEARLYNEYAALAPERQARILPFVARWCSARAARFDGRAVMSAYMEVTAMQQAAVATSEPFDFVLSPVSPILPYAAESAAPGDDPENALPHIAFTVPYSMSGQPAASLPWTFSTEGLPVGIQVIGRRFDDLGVLRVSRWLETARPQQRAWPEPA